MLIQASWGACAKLFLHLHFVIWQPGYQESDGCSKQAFDVTQCRHRASLVAQLVENLPAMQEIPVQFLGQEDPLEKV